MFYVLFVWIGLLLFWPRLSKQRLADRISLTRVPLTLVVVHCLTERFGWTSSPQWCWPVPSDLGLVWLAIVCQCLSWLFDVLDGRIARDSRQGGTKWGRFVDATTDKISTWPVAVLIIIWFHQERWGEVSALVAFGVYLPLILLGIYDWGYSTVAHYRKASQAIRPEEIDVGANRVGHILGQAKHWAWSIMIGFHLFELAPVVSEHGNSFSNVLARFAQVAHPFTWGLLWVAVLSAAGSMWIRLRKVDGRRPEVAEASTSMVDSSD